jgi:hypothetical protein
MVSLSNTVATVDVIRIRYTAMSNIECQIIDTSTQILSKYAHQIGEGTDLIGVILKRSSIDGGGDSVVCYNKSRVANVLTSYTPGFRKVPAYQESLTFCIAKYNIVYIANSLQID